MFAAIATDGIEPVVWGLGPTADAAILDAVSHFESECLDGPWNVAGHATVRVGPLTACDIEVGTVRCHDLGITVKVNGRGLICDATAPTHTAKELESAALRWRAEAGIIPHRLYAALSPTARARLAVLSQTAAQREVIAAIPITEEPAVIAEPLPPHPLDDLAIESLRKRSP